MKKIYFYLSIIFVLLLLIAFGIIKSQKTSSLRIDKRNFSIQDTLLINQITIENRSLEKIKLNRDHNADQWILNDSLIANQYLINLLLKTIKSMKVKKPIARAALPNIIKRMAVQNTRVDIFQKNKKIKTIYIGGETPDQLGTFMMIDGAKEPYVVHIPGFNGYLSSRFSCKEELWMSKKIFNNKIISGKYIFKNFKKKSFLKSESLIKLNNIYCESFLTSNKDFDVNEIKNRIPFLTIEIENKNKNIERLYCVRKKPTNKEKYKNHKYDRERFYGIKDNKLMLIQYKQFENLIQSESIRNDFLPWKKQTLN